MIDHLVWISVPPPHTHTHIHTNSHICHALHLRHAAIRQPWSFCIWGPFYQNGLTLIPEWINNHIPNKVSGKSTFEVWKWISNFILHFIMDVIAFSCCDWSQSRLGEGVPNIIISYIGLRVCIFFADPKCQLIYTQWNVVHFSYVYICKFVKLIFL